MDPAAVYYAVTTLFYLGTLIFAGVAGRKAQRWCAAFAFTTMITGWFVGNAVAGLNVAIDTIFGVSLLILFVFYRHLWLACALVAQLLVIVFSTTRMLQFPLTPGEYVLMLNLSSLGVFASILVGTVHARWGSSTDADAEHWGYARAAG